MAEVPGGIALSLAGCELRARRGAVDAVVSMFESDLDGECPTLASATLLATGALVVVTNVGQRRTLAAGRIESRLDLASARGRPAARAERLLERSVRADPGFESAAVELAWARLRLGRMPDAVDAVRPFLDRAPVRFYARVVADERLAPLLEQPAFAAVRAAVPGTARLSDGKPLVAHAPERRLFAIELRRQGVDAERTDLLVFGPSTLVLELPLIDEAGHRPRSWRLRANRVLRDFGFVVPAGLEQDAFARRASLSDAVRFPRARLGISHAEGVARLFEGGHAIASRRLYRTGPEERCFSCEYPPTLHRAAWIPGERTVLLIWATSGAEWTEVTTVVEVWTLDQPGGRIVLPIGADPEVPHGTGSV